MVKVKEVTYCKESVTPDNVYVIDNGLQIYQVNAWVFILVFLSSIFIFDRATIQLADRSSRESADCL